MSHLISVAYHYVLDGSLPAFRGLRGLSDLDLAAQVDLLRTRYEFIRPEEFHDEPWRDGRPRCLITFDDGTKDHLHVAARVLGARDVRAMFFVTTSVLAGRGYIPAHLLHQLLAVRSPQDLAAKANVIAEREGMNVCIDLSRPQDYYPYDDQPTGSLKYHLNHLFSFQIGRRIIERLFVAEIGSIEGFQSSFYLDRDDVLALERAGHTIAGHSHEHRNLGGAPLDEMEADVAASAATLDRLRLTRGRAHFAMPFGGAGTFNAPVLAALAAHGFRHVHVAHRAVNHAAADVVYRFSTKQLPPYVAGWPETQS